MSAPGWNEYSKTVAYGRYQRLASARRIGGLTDDEIANLVIHHATGLYRYREEELSYMVAGIITEQLAIDDEDVDGAEESGGGEIAHYSQGHGLRSSVADAPGGPVGRT